MASIFKDKKPPFGKYYISDPLNNSIITVSDTKVVFESVYKNEYSKIEFTNPLTSLKDQGFDGSYSIEPVTIGSNKLYLTVMYAPSRSGYEQPIVTIMYRNSLTDASVNTFVSFAGVNQNPPPGFIPPLPQISPQTLPPSPQTLPPSPQTLPPLPQTLPPSPQTLPPSTPSTKTPSTTSTKSFFDKYFIYIVVFIILVIMSLAGWYFFIKNKKPTISK